MDEQALRSLLLGWTALGPFRTPAQLVAEIAAVAAVLGDGDAPVLAATLAALDREGDDRAGVLMELLDHYLPAHREALATALLAVVAADGPPEVVEALGCTGCARVIPCLRALIAAPQSVAVGVTAACALGMIGGTEALALLIDVADRADLDEAIRDEARIALELSARAR